MTEQQDDHAHVIPLPPPLIYAVPLVLALLFGRRAPGLPLPKRLRLLLGTLLLSSGIGGAGWFFRSLLGAETTLHPDQPVSALVTTGPFARSRNPGYLSMAAIYSGVSLIANSLSSMFLLPVILLVITRGVIGPEEQYLERRFDEDYQEYKGRVRRWI